MTNNLKFALWGVFAFFALGVGLYPGLYFLIDMKKGFLGSKPAALLQENSWVIAFYLHISFGGLSLISGFSQFSSQLRKRKVKLHRLLGKIYLTSVLISGTSGLFIAIHATGGRMAEMGFGSLGILWLLTSVMAFKSIRNGEVTQHRHWMIRSFALTFAAVTLRLWLPFFQIVLHFSFIDAYIIIAWLCWIPNLVIAEIIIRTSNKKSMQSA
ncbi:DUF2306 domain-containing protein [Reichenbachiella sp. MALMAid0571]|uniref:DUF2306 domain-containing protein n=1 Tax=Reichenbachiella sp. MALMAid0571 TaxID=3143939 RepID=UPI0032DF7EA0